MQKKKQFRGDVSISLSLPLSSLTDKKPLFLKAECSLTTLQAACSYFHNLKNLRKDQFFNVVSKKIFFTRITVDYSN